jgi:two-component system, response regulator RegA
LTQHHVASTGYIHDSEREATIPVVDACPKNGLLLIEASRGNRAILQRMLTSRGFDVTSVTHGQQAYTETELRGFGYAIVSLGARDRNGFDLVRHLRRRQVALRIVVTTDVDSFASAIMALRAGADDYVASSAGSAELIDALLDRSPELPPVPDMPLGLSRVSWEHIMRIHEQCGRNVTVTAQRLGMHRRSVQRILSKRAPQARADTTMPEPPDTAASRVRRQSAVRGRHQTRC